MNALCPAKQRMIVGCLLLALPHASIHAGPLHDAVEKGDIEKLEQLLSKRRLSCMDE